ncbi:MAG: hypothetical protein ACP5NK_01575 [Thermoplasmata archaeon]
MVYEEIAQISVRYNQNQTGAPINVSFYTNAVMQFFWKTENTSAFQQNISRDNGNFTSGMASNGSADAAMNETFFVFNTYGQEFTQNGVLYFHNFAWKFYFGTMKTEGPVVTDQQVIYM